MCVLFVYVIRKEIHLILIRTQEVLKQLLARSTKNISTAELIVLEHHSKIWPYVSNITLFLSLLKANNKTHSEHTSVLKDKQ
jgi:hypothetical protein